MQLLLYALCNHQNGASDHSKRIVTVSDSGREEISETSPSRLMLPQQDTVPRADQAPPPALYHWSLKGRSYLDAGRALVLADVIKLPEDDRRRFSGRLFMNSVQTGFLPTLRPI